jgi:putative transposase
MKDMACRKRHSAEDIVHKLRRADELAAEGKTGEEIAAELGVSAATLYNRRRAYGAWTPMPPENSKSSVSRTPASSGCWPRPNSKRRVAGGREGKILSPAAKRRAVDMLTTTLSMSERLACKAVGLARSTHRRLPAAQTPNDPDAEMRAWLRADATKHPCHGFRRAWARCATTNAVGLTRRRFTGSGAKKGLQVRVHSPRKGGRGVSIRPIDADALNVVWSIDFQFDSTTDGKAIKIASMIDEHTRLSLLHVVERSITAERLVVELETAFAAAGGPPKVLRMDNGPKMVSQALQRFCDRKTGMVYIPPGTPWNNGYIESFNNRLRKECLNRNHWNTLFEARVVTGDFKHEHNHRHRHSALGYMTPAEYAAGCRHTHSPVACDINRIRNKQTRL